MITKNELSDTFFRFFPYEPTTDQVKVIDKLCDFLLSGDPLSMFVLKGYAGTGKTTIVSNLVRILPVINLQAELMAPTGRAAKVIAGYSGKKAFTIHRKIYRLVYLEGVFSGFSLLHNKYINTIFIVDEASMISDNRAQGGNHVSQNDLLDDLMEFVYSGHNCRLILIGDNAQLPPVHSEFSPALHVPTLKSKYHFQIWWEEMQEVVRQQIDSGILHNATRIRMMTNTEEKGFIQFELNGFKDIKRLIGYETADQIQECFSSRSFEDTVVVCRSNKRANLYNQSIRARVLFREDEIGAGDLIMVVKNNYFWLSENSAAGFIANGDILEVLRIQKIEELYGFRFAKVTIRMIDYPDEPEVELIILLDVLDFEGPSLNYESYQNLFNEVSKDYEDIPSKRKRMAKIKANPYLNALQVKFAYAITCHKAQGGQWENVFVEMGYIPDKMPDKNYYRWLYTAVTRASANLYLMGFTEEFF